MIMVTALSKLVLSWLDFDHSTKEKLSASAGDYFGKGILALILLAGFGILIIRLRRELCKKATRQSLHPFDRENTLPQNVPPFPADNGTRIVQTKNGKKKGCIILVVILVMLPIFAITFIWYLASEYEKQPKKPGQLAVYQANQFIGTYNETEACGNTPEATELGGEFARTLRIARGYLITEGRTGVGDRTEGRFLTYCFLTEESAAFIVHVPGLRNFSADAKLTLEETAWNVATHAITLKHPQVKKLALGIKGDLDYSSIVTGSVNPEVPLKGVEARHPTFPDKPLWPYFIDAVQIEPK